MENVVEFKDLERGDTLQLKHTEEEFVVSGVICGLIESEFAGSSVSLSAGSQDQYTFFLNDYIAISHYRPHKYPAKGAFILFKTPSGDWFSGIWEGSRFRGVSKNGETITVMSGTEAILWKYI